MKIEEIDDNLKIATSLPEKEIDWFDASKDGFVRYGVAPSSEGYLRLPRQVAESVNAGVGELCDNPSGVRVRFCTDSPFVAIRAAVPSVCRFPHMSLSGSGGFDLYKQVGSLQSYVGTFIPPLNGENGFEGLLYTGRSFGRPVNYILNFPPYNPLSRLYIGLKKGSETGIPEDYVNDKPVVFYGSSITQGGCASRPGNTYQNFLSRALCMDYVCLGFSGSAKGEKEIAEYMAELEMCAFVCDYDHNAPNAAYLRNTHFALYETIRGKKPETPYVMISHPSEGINEGVMRRKTVMESYLKALDKGDRNVFFIDGDSLFAGEESDNCTVDGCHPNDLGFYRMAQGILPVLKKILYNK